jgi:hypothetical protein
MGILNYLDRRSWPCFDDLVIGSSWQVVDADQFLVHTVKNRGEWTRNRIMIVLCVIQLSDIQVALEQVSAFIFDICSMHPGFYTHSNPRRKLQFLNLRNSCGMFKAYIFHF